MPRAEAGSLKAISNQMKSKGLQRLRWYCQVCEKQCRDENGFKCHTMSESHVRNMQVVGANAKTFIDQYSNDFKRDFLQLLRTSHGTKGVQINQFYQQYIANKEHVHMNATKWKSLSEFAKYLGREGLCKVEENEKGLHIAWVDRSPEAHRRQEAVRKKERQLQGDQKLEEKMIQQQVKRARQAAEEAASLREDGADKKDRADSTAQGGEGVPISFGFKFGSKAESSGPAAPVERTDEVDKNPSNSSGDTASPIPSADDAAAKPAMKMSFGSNANGPKPKNGLKPSNGLKKGNALSSKRGPALAEPTRKMTEAERIMKEEIEAERKRKERGFGERDAKRVKV